MKPLTIDEIFIINSLIEISPIEINIPVALDKCHSIPMNDGGMGSFKIIYPNEICSDFGKLKTVGTEIYYSDYGKYVNITLLVDEDFIPREIDSFVGDFSLLTKPFKIKNIKNIYLV